MRTNYKTEAIAELAAEIKKAGFRVFIAASGTYGFYTDADGTRVVCFQYDLAGMKFSGNYKTDLPKQCGTGWLMGSVVNYYADTFKSMFESSAPQWAVRGANWKHTTLAQHLATYQGSSKYMEVTLALGERVKVAHGTGVVVGWEAFDCNGMQAENSLIPNGNRVAIKLDDGHSWSALDQLYYEIEKAVELLPQVEG